MESGKFVNKIRKRATRVCGYREGREGWRALHVFKVM